MLKISSTGSSIKDVLLDTQRVRTLTPYATATALTRTAKLAQADIAAAMSKVFDRPTRYTLNSTFVQPATKDKLAARVAVKTGRTEDFLVPEVEGGVRKEKGFERKLRYAGVLQAGERAMPGKGVRLDANGNMVRGELNAILSVLKDLRGAGTRHKLKNELFVGTPRGGNRPNGIWRRERGLEGGQLRALLVFTKTQPHYGVQLQFAESSKTSSQRHIRAEFDRAMQDMLARRQKARA